MTAQPDFDTAIAYALDQLRLHLDPRLVYHNLWHTEGDVMPGAMELAALSGVSGREQKMLQVAAAYHDIGFIEAYEGHELVSVRVAQEALPGFGFAEGDVAQIVTLIRATIMPQSPQNLLGEILADADLGVLGRADFFERGEILRQETAVFVEFVPPLTWDQRQLLFLQQHAYFTPAARKLRVPGKEKHIAMLQERIRKGLP
ncbi:MAG: phosphohydrolase [Anaerolinea sp.]|nr:phosphohydrolase [Anaerolinea sp.]